MSAVEAADPVLWSDFDGTAVETVGLFNPRNWAKYPLEGITGYAEFLEGVQEQGVAIGGIVSRRPNILPRRYVTDRSIAELGLDRFFPDADQRVLTGDEDRKGIFVVGEAQKGPVGMIDDKPHRIGPSLIGALIETPLDVETPTITLGVVNHDRSKEYVDRFIDRCESAESGVEVARRFDDSFALRSHDDRFVLDVVQLPSFSGPAGEAFAELLFDAI